MKKGFKITFLSFATIFGLRDVAFAQTANPVAMRYTGTQNYRGSTTTMLPRQIVKTAPVINSVYSQPMQRINEIPLYGKNKYMYFYDQKRDKSKEGNFSNSGLYMFASFSTGNTSAGINADKDPGDNNNLISAGSSDNKDMGTANGLTLGVGRVMSSDLSVEFFLSSYSGMKYGDYMSYSYYDTAFDEDGNEIEDNPETEEDESTELMTDKYEVIKGGGISSKFIGLGFRYNLENVFGIFGGRLKPYFGFQIGIAENTIDDYTVSEPDGETTSDDYTTADLLDENNTERIDEAAEIAANYDADHPDSETTIYDGEITYIGSTKRNFGYGLEAGFSVELEGNIELEFFYKMNRFGKVETSGNVLSDYLSETTEFYVIEASAANPIGEKLGSIGDDYDLYSLGTEDTGSIQTLIERTKESGDLNFHQYGIKLKYMF